LSLIAQQQAVSCYLNACFIVIEFVHVEFYLYPTVGTVLIHSVKPELNSQPASIKLDNENIGGHCYTFTVH